MTGNESWVEGSPSDANRRAAAHSADRGRAAAGDPTADDRVVAIHQPNYLPWAGYFEKILRSDVFVFLDDVEYSSDSYTNRNRIKTPDGWTWLTVPVRGSGGPIADVAIATDQRWRENHRKNLRYNYANAPYREAFDDLFDRAYDRDWRSLAALNAFLIRELADRLGLTCRFVRSSSLDVAGTGTDRLVAICEELDAERYLSGAGARSYLSPSTFEAAGIDVAFQSYETPRYEQQHDGFVPDLSVVDPLFNRGPEGTVELLREGANR